MAWRMVHGVQLARTASCLRQTSMHHIHQERPACKQQQPNVWPKNMNMTLTLATPYFCLKCCTSALPVHVNSFHLIASCARWL